MAENFFAPRNAVSGTVKMLMWHEYLALFDESVHAAITHAASAYAAEFVVCYECLDMSSSHLGERVSMCVGPRNTYKTLGFAAEGHIGSVPSRFKYPTCYAVVPESVRTAYGETGPSNDAAIDKREPYVDPT